MASTIGLIPYGILPNGNYGVSLDNVTGKPRASVVEVLGSLPAVSNADNFDGRIVFSLADYSLNVFKSSPTARWEKLEKNPVTVTNVSGNPPTTPTPTTGEMLYDLDTSVLFLWTGSAWVSVGGNTAATIIENIYTGDGVTTNFSVGAPGIYSNEEVEVFIDGVRQYNPASYSVIGNNVSFTTPPLVGTEVLIRAMIPTTITPNAEISNGDYVASSGQTDFNIGMIDVDPSGVFVFLNGIIQKLGIDYQIVTQDTTISSLTKPSVTVARIITNAPHNLSVGNIITLHGFLEVDYEKQSFTVSSIVNSTTFEINVPATAPSNGTPNPVAYFTPKQVSDIVSFNTPLNGGDNVVIRAFRNIVGAPPSSGEANTLQSVGTGDSLVAPKVGTVLQIKGLVSGSGIAINDIGTDLQISSTTISGFEDRVSFNTSSYSISGNESYVGVRNTSGSVVVDLSTISPTPTNSGRRITVKDESGGASPATPINIVAGSSLFDGSPGPLSITNAYGSVTLVFDGSDWFIISRI